MTSQANYDEKAFYILIKTENNQTVFVPDKVTLTAGDKIIWINQDNSGHRISVGSDSKTGYQLMNVAIPPNGMLDHQFQLSGTYFSVLDNLISKGDITILDKGNEDHAVSIPLVD
jgi:plastocyanin